ncbi:uncharacterized protein G6M90_00g051930 [Metarhizium brunneum]|uniref:Capsule polysaccharide biosynthesis protein n=1 Tax=Metarhizium brunneum TaxID=500148 RepID=A0A7D5UXG8_9HYPO
MSLISSTCVAGVAVGLTFTTAIFGPNLKCLPGMYHIRSLYSVLVWKNRAKLDDHQSLFKPEVLTTWCPLMEIDMNLHKTNSSYFSDLDESRLRVLARVFPDCLQLGGAKVNLALGGVACTFFKAISPLQKYELQSQILSWDEKWLYMASYFLVSGGSRRLSAARDGPNQDEKALEEVARSVVIAAVVSKYCFKEGRKTVSPETMLRRRKILSPESEDELSRKNMEGMRIALSLNQMGALRAAL